MSGIEAEHYGEIRRALQADPIIRAMADELTATASPADRAYLTHDNGAPRFSFMNEALREYTARGGQVQTHIGGPAEAVLALLKSAEADRALLRMSDEESTAAILAVLDGGPEPGQYGYETEQGDESDDVRAQHEYDTEERT